MTHQFDPEALAREMHRRTYAGVTYEFASREAERLIAIGWFKHFDRLSALHEVMRQHLRASEHQSDASEQKEVVVP